MQQALSSVVWLLVAVILATIGPASAEVELFTTMDDQDYGRTNRLGLVDPTSGTVSEIGPTGAEVGAIAFAPDGRLFGVDSTADSLMILDIDTGAATLVGSLGFDVDRMSGLTVDQSGAVWLVDSTPYGSRLYSVNPVSGAATLRGEVGYNDCQTLAAIGDTVYGDGFQELVIDTETGLGEPVAPNHSSYPSIVLTADPAGVLWSIRYCSVCMGVPSVPWELTVTSTRTWESQTIAALDSRWEPRGLAARQLQQQAIPMLHPLLLVLLAALLAAAGSAMLLRSGL